MKQLFLHRATLLLLLILLGICSLFVGVTKFSILDLWQLTPYMTDVLVQVRIPRLLTLILSGMGMSVAGLIMQQLVQNKFASPSTATTLDGAKLGVLLTLLVFGNNLYTTMVGAFAFAVVSTGIFIVLVQSMKLKNVVFVPLLGLMLGGIIDSITTFIAYQTDKVQQLSTWTQANLASILKGNYEILYIIIPVLIISIIYANQFTIAGMGKHFSQNLGINHQKIMVIGLVIVALITTTVIVGVGSIPFVGVVVPNIVSLYRGDNLKHSITETALLGAIFLIACDIVSRIVIFPYEMPLTTTVGIVGGGLFLIFIYRSKKNDVST